MEKTFDDLIYESGIIAQGCWDKFDDYDKQALYKFARLIVKECGEIAHCNFHVSGVALAHIFNEHFDIKEETVEELLVEERKHIGYIEREEGFYKIYAPLKGQIVTQAFVICKYCNGTIYHCTGPKSDAVCFECYDKDSELR